MTRVVILTILITCEVLDGELGGGGGEGEVQ